MLSLASVADGYTIWLAIVLCVPPAIGLCSNSSERQSAFTRLTILGIDFCDIGACSKIFWKRTRSRSVSNTISTSPSFASITLCAGFGLQRSRGELLRFFNLSATCSSVLRASPCVDIRALLGCESRLVGPPLTGLMRRSAGDKLRGMLFIYCTGCFSNELTG